MQESTKRRPWWSILFWWTMTLLVLMVTDDLVFGWIFWVLSLWSQLGAAIIAWIASFALQLWLLGHVLLPGTNRLANWFLGRLRFGHSGHLAPQERVIRHRVASTISAILASPLIGGVLPIIILSERNLADQDKRRVQENRAWLCKLGQVTSAIYATEFALIHGGYGLGNVLRAVWPW